MSEAIDKQFEIHAGVLSSEMSKGEKRNFAVIEHQIRCLIALSLHVLGGLDRQYARDLAQEIKLQAHDIKGTYNTWGQLTVTVISAGFNIAGGVFSSMSAMGGAYANYKQIGKGLSFAGQGVQGLGGIINFDKEGERTVLNVKLHALQEKQKSRSNAGSEKKQSCTQIIDTAQRAEESRHQTFGSFTARA